MYSQVLHPVADCAYRACRDRHKPNDNDGMSFVWYPCFSCVRFSPLCFAASYYYWFFEWYGPRALLLFVRAQVYNTCFRCVHSFRWLSMCSSPSMYGFLHLHFTHAHTHGRLMCHAVQINHSLNRFFSPSILVFGFCVIVRFSLCIIIIILNVVSLYYFPLFAIYIDTILIIVFLLVGMYSHCFYRSNRLLDLLRRLC